MSTSLECGLTSRNLPPLTRGSNQPWYWDEVLSIRNVCVSLVVGCAMTETKVQNSKDNILCIFQKPKDGKLEKKKEKERDRRPKDGGGRGDQRSGRRKQRPRSTKQGVCGRPSPSLLTYCKGYHDQWKIFPLKEPRNRESKSSRRRRRLLRRQ